MLVFWKEKLVFLAVPKTGTTALSGALAPKAALVLREPPGLKHSPVSRYRRFLQPFFDTAGGQDMETVAVVRDPVDWLGSWYRYRHRPHLAGNPKSTQGISFDDFVTAYMAKKPPGFADVGSQAKFLLTSDGKIGVTHLFRYEAQDKLISFLETRLATKIVLNRLNVSPTMPVALSAPVEAALRQHRAAEFDVWQAGIGG